MNASQTVPLSPEPRHWHRFYDLHGSPVWVGTGTGMGHNGSSSEPCSNGLPLLPPEPCLAGSGRCLNWVRCFAAPCGAPDDPFRFLVVAVTLEVLGLPRP